MGEHTGNDAVPGFPGPPGGEIHGSYPTNLSGSCERGRVRRGSIARSKINDGSQIEPEILRGRGIALR